MNNRRPQVFHILWSFTLTFLIARGLIYLTDIKNTLPDFYFSLFGYHLHHFNLGILAIVFTGYAAITNLHVPKKYLAILFGFGLGLIVDEFGLLISLQDDYWLRQTYDVVIVVLALLINIEYFSDFWNRILRNLFGKSKKKEVLEIKNYPKVSVVIPVYNEEAFLPQTLESLKNQNYSGEVEIIVVDNGSTDNTAKIAQKLGARVITETHQGPAYARQNGLQAASGEIVASTDADVILPTRWLTYIVDEFNKHPKVIAICGTFDFYDGSLLLRTLFAIFAFPAIKLFDLAFEANFAVKKDQFLKAGGFDTNHGFYETEGIAKRLKPYGQVLKLSSFKVKASARRFNQIGLARGLWEPFSLYLKFKRNKKDASFKPAAQLIVPSILARLISQLAIVSFLIILLASGIFGIKPVRAEVMHLSKNIRHNLATHFPRHHQNKNVAN